MEAVLEVHRLTKRFPGVQALREVSFRLHAGEVVGLVGENGAGKSTLVKILAGIYRPDGGEIHLQGKAVHFAHPQEAALLGLSFVHQQLALVPSLSVVDNVFLGRWKSRTLGVLDRKVMQNAVEALCQEFAFPLKLDLPVRELSTSERWMVQILRAFLVKPLVLIMDEPTAALPEEEVERLFQVVRRVTAQGVGVLYVSHRLGEIFSLCQRVVVLRNGEKAWEGEIAGLSTEELIGKMVGQKGSPATVMPMVPGEEVVLEVFSLSDGEKLRDVSFFLRRGEILGVYGLQGSGRTELLETLFGARRRKEGKVFLRGKPFVPVSPQKALEAGVALVPEDRGKKGLVLRHSLFENVALPHLAAYQGFLGYFRERALRPFLLRVMERLRTRYHSLKDQVQFLSGGNQQKVVLAKWLLRDFTVFLLDEPTVGVDVGARRELYQFIRELSQEGRAVLFTSSDLEEILEVRPHRVMVLREGRMAGILEGGELSREAILRLCYEG